MRNDDIAPLLITPGDPDLAYRQGVVVEWNPTTGANTITVSGREIHNVPRLAQVGALNPGDVVALLRYQSTYLLLGRITAPVPSP